MWDCDVFIPVIMLSRTRMLLPISADWLLLTRWSEIEFYRDVYIYSIQYNLLNLLRTTSEQLQVELQVEVEAPQLHSKFKWLDMIPALQSVESCL